MQRTNKEMKMSDGAILIMFHCRDDAGFAIKKLESVFVKAAIKAGFTRDAILLSYSELTKQSDEYLLLDYYSSDGEAKFREVITRHNITTVVAFDMRFPSRVAQVARKSGVHLISYWGASMSGINSGLKLLAKKAEWALKKSRAPHHFVFESEAMRRTATHGRGVPEKYTSVIYLGADLKTYYPATDDEYTRTEFGIPAHRKIVFYSGHMETRKGVRVILKAANVLHEKNALENIHFVLCGNKGNEATKLLEVVGDDVVKSHITFGGYRDDIPALMRGSDIGVIASTGWDSFTRSSVEMLASGLPLIVSNLGGLPESTQHGKTGWHFEPGNAEALADYLAELCNNDEMRQEFSKNARLRAEQSFDEDMQVNQLAKLIQEK